MTTPYLPRYVLLRRDASILNLGTRRHDFFDHATLLGAPPKRGGNRVVPGVRGTAVRPRVAGELRAIIAGEVNGKFDDDNQLIAGGADAWAASFLAALDELYTMTDDDDPLTVEVHLGADVWAGTLLVEDPGTPQVVDRHLGRLAMDVTLPDGRLELQP